MKSLKEYILEKCENGNCSEPASSKSFTFKFYDFDNAKETIESLTKMAEDKGLTFSAEENKFTLTVTREQCENHDIAGIQDVLQQYTEIIRKDSKNSSNESHAQKTKEFAKKLDEMIAYIDDVEEYEEPSEDPTEEE